MCIRQKEIMSCHTINYPLFRVSATSEIVACFAKGLGLAHSKWKCGVEGCVAESVGIWHAIEKH